MTALPKAKRTRRSYQISGVYALRADVKRRGLRAVDARTVVGRALHSWRAQMLTDLGGEQSLSAAQLAILDCAVRTRLILDHIDGYILACGSIINARKRALFPVVRERAQLADSFARQLAMLGLERRQAEVLDVAGEIARQRQQEANAST